MVSPVPTMCVVEAGGKCQVMWKTSQNPFPPSENFSEVPVLVSVTGLVTSFKLPESIYFFLSVSVSSLKAEPMYFSSFWMFSSWHTAWRACLDAP